MDFRSLEYIVHVAKSGNISQSAEQLFVSQSTISKSIKKTEDQLKSILFNRVGNHLVLTYAGERFVALANDILLQQKNLVREMEELAGETVGALSVAFPTVRITYMLPRVLPVFHKMYPDVKIQLCEAASSQIDAMLLSGKVDLAFYNLVTPTRGIVYNVLNREEIVLIVSERHPLLNRVNIKTIKGSKYPWIDLKQFEDDIFLLQPPTHRMGRLALQLFAQENFSPAKTLSLDSIVAAANLAATGYGICIISETHLNNITVNNRYRCFSIGSPLLFSNFVFAFRKGNYLSKYAKDFADIVKQNI